MQMRKQGANTKTINGCNEQIVERVLEATGYEFECKQIVGHTIDGIADHAEHVRSGGCADLI